MVREREKNVVPLRSHLEFYCSLCPCTLQQYQCISALYSEGSSEAGAYRTLQKSLGEAFPQQRDTLRYCAWTRR
jgi:hypothetical protein